MLKVSALKVTVEGKPILNGVNLSLKTNQIHALMGPNGSGKSTFSQALMGHPHYLVNGHSQATLNGVSLLDKTPDERAHEGLFLAFQHPVSIPGVSVQNAIKTAYEAIHCTGCTLHDHCPKLSVTDFRSKLAAAAKTLGLAPAILSRPLNDGFSGGEKKRLEMLSLLTLRPQIAILDETDSGLDIDSLKLVAGTVKNYARSQPAGILIITHYRRILDYIRPDIVSVMVQGQIVVSGGPELVDQIEARGYSQFR